MSELVIKKANEILPVVKELIEKGNGVRITVTGMSMYPFLRGNKDNVDLVQIDFSLISRGDIILIQRVTGEYVLHRVIKKKKDSIYLNGDAQQWCEGPIHPQQIIAKVSTVWRNGRGISCDNIIWRVLSFIWRMVFPVRYLIIKIYQYKHKIKQMLQR